MARRSSKNTDGTRSTHADTETPDDSVTAGTAGQDSVSPEGPTDEMDLAEAGDTPAVTDAPGIEDAETLAPDGDATVVVGGDGDASLVSEDKGEMAPDGETSETPEGDMPEADDTTMADAVDGDIVKEGETVEETDATGDTEETPEEPPVETMPTPAAPATVIERRGPGFVPLVLGGVVAVGLGYGASYIGLLPTPGDDAATGQLETLISQQSETLSALQAQVTALAEAEPPQAPAVDLSPVTDQINALGGRLDETAAAIESLAGRVTLVEDRPIFTGEGGADLAAAAETVTELEGQLRAQEEESARLAAEAEAAQSVAAEAAAQAEAEAQAAIAEAQAEAQSVMDAATAQAALGALRSAVATGAPFGDAVDDLAAATEVPEALSAAADTGVATVEELQDGFPPAARAALPVALRETAGDAPMERIAAFLQGQVGGRSIEPREGDDPDAVLSRAQAAVNAADFATALSEIAALPEAAQAEMAGWVSEAETRAAVDAALVTVADALAGSN